MTNRKSLLRVITLSALVSLSAGSAFAQTTLIKANNTNALNTSASWTTTPLFNGTEIGTWDSTVTTANTTSLGASISLAGIRITNPGGNVRINNTVGATLSLGASGIDLSGSNVDRELSLRAAVSLTANQVWNMGTNGQYNPGVATNTINLGSYTLTLQQTGISTSDSYFDMFGTISGSGSLIMRGVNTTAIGTPGSVINFYSSNYTGSTTVETGAVRLYGATGTAFAGSSGILINSGQIWFETNRTINSGVPISIFGGRDTLGLSGIRVDMSGDVNIGSTSIRAGTANIFWGNGGASGDVTLSNLTRDSDLKGIFVLGAEGGTNYLGSTTEVRVTNNPPTLSGSGAPGTTSVGVVPWAIG